jgi:spore coat polysaccharide biosynthesis protein SpsF
MRTVVIIQARMGSHRLPGKVTRKIIGKPLLEHLVERLRQTKQVNQIIIATTTAPIDKEISVLAEALNVPVFRGSEENVLDRFFLAAQWAKADIVIRVTADNPLTDAANIDRMVEEHLKNNADYTTTIGMPLGTTAEVISMDILHKAHNLAKNQYDLEHVTPFIRRQPKLFKVQTLQAHTELSRPDIRLTVDYLEDFEFITEIYKALYKPNEVFPLLDVIKLLDNSNVQTG